MHKVDEFEKNAKRNHKRIEPQWASIVSPGEGVLNTDIAQQMLSTHALLRCGQRGLSVADLAYVVARGTYYEGNDADYIYLRQADILPCERKTMSRLVGTALVLSKRGMVITVWRNQRHGLRNIRAKLASGPY